MHARIMNSLYALQLILGVEKHAVDYTAEASHSPQKLKGCPTPPRQMLFAHSAHDALISTGKLLTGSADELTWP